MKPIQPMPAFEKKVPFNISLTPTQKAKLQRLGGARWVQYMVDRAKEPKS